MGGLKKEYCPLPGDDNTLTVLGAAVSAFIAFSEIGTIVIVVPEDPVLGENTARKALCREILSVEKTGHIIRFVPGGKTRRTSVYNALFSLAANNTQYVLVHDGARPWVSYSLIEQIIAGVKKYRAVIPLLPLTETPKETDVPLDNSFGTRPIFIKQQLRRAVIGTAQTPQAFSFPEILNAHKKAALEANSCEGAEYTDDAEVWAAFCGPVAVIPGESTNRKITFPEDILL
jgi:2-C-methyl-D-erythritol 4-phosphate cytidylyltransferase